MAGGSLGIPHTLAPDVVHAISLLDPFEPDPSSDAVVFQAATGLLERIGHRPLARMEAEMARRTIFRRRAVRAAG